MFCTLITLLVLSVFGYILRSIIKPSKFPPGPKWYPLLGCSGTVETMRKEYGSQWKGLSVLAKKYSTQVLGLKLGQELVVVVYGEKNVKQVFTGAEFEGRPDTFFVKLRCLGKRMGITFTDGPLWKIHRQFTVKQLRNVGFGKTEMEREIQNEMINVLKYLEESCFKPINLKSTLAISVMNILWKFTAGEQIEKERLKHLIDLLNARSKAFSMAGGWLNQAPWSRYIFPTLSGCSLIATINQQISDIIEEAINKHKTRAVKTNDFMYAFLSEIAENKETFTEEQLKTICLDLLIAGSQTTSNVLEFALLALLRNKTLQEKVHEEIDRVIGTDTPCWADSFRLIFTSAFLLEVQRYYTIVPLAGPRRVLEDTVIDGYHIPKDTTVLISVGDIHFTSELWTDPNDFRPERFIDERGALKNVEHLYPFGLGRRRCPGDALAKSFIFIVLIGIMQNFNIEGCNGLLPSDKPIIGLISAPKPYKAVFVPRH